MNHLTAPPAPEVLLDCRLVERVEHALTATGYPALRAVQVVVRGRSVVLRGRVPTYYMKQLAQTIALEVVGDGHLCNDVEV